VLLKALGWKQMNGSALLYAYATSRRMSSFSKLKPSESSSYTLLKMKKMLSHIMGKVQPCEVLVKSLGWKQMNESALLYAYATSRRMVLLCLIMAPTRKYARKPRKALKGSKKSKKETNMLSSSPVKLSSDNNSVVLKKVDEIISIGCTTPKAQKYQIPEILTCPPAPKKRRILTSCTLRRTPISFFDPPDIELFFASHLASVYSHVHTHVR
ncbi:cyclin-dependent protein kinase inhibitor SMR13-like protein, partial [Tanacetum coccineum]